MSVSSNAFLAELSSAVPESQELVAEHLAFHEELLLHLLIADLRRMAIAMFEQDELDPLRRLLAVLDRSLAEGDDFVSNAVAVSFVEDTGWWDPEMSGFMGAWPAGLTAEAERQRQWRPGTGGVPD
ncbi:MAG TPA: hypothetical protein VMM60_05940 [Ilumatobacter sp.]|nr:hypothetical protein [Ilumatobacter sp.]